MNSFCSSPRRISSAVCFVLKTAVFSECGEDFVSVAAAALCFVERDIGIYQYVGQRLLPFRLVCDADADADAAVLLLVFDRHAHGIDDALCEGGVMALDAALAGNDDELVPADAADEIVVSGVVAQDLGCMPQDFVAGRVAEGVVDFLEAIEIDVENAGEVLRRGAGTSVGENLVEVAPVRQARQRIVQGIEFHSMPGSFQFGAVRLGLSFGRFEPLAVFDIGRSRPS